MANSKKIQNWLKIRIAEKQGILKEIEEKVKREMKNIKIEIKEEDKWIEA